MILGAHRFEVQQGGDYLRASAARLLRTPAYCRGTACSMCSRKHRPRMPARFVDRGGAALRLDAHAGFSVSVLLKFESCFGSIRKELFQNQTSLRRRR